MVLFSNDYLGTYLTKKSSSFLGIHAETTNRSPSALTDSQLKVHSGWVNIWQNIIIELDSYVREHHSRGFKWKKEN